VAGFFGTLAGWLGFDRTKTPTTNPAGTDGEAAPGGLIQSREQSHDLTGQRLYTTFINTIHQSVIVAAAARNYLALAGGAKWTALENRAGGKDAKRGVEILRDGLLESPMPRPWQSCVKKQAYFHFAGFAAHAWTIRRREDGLVVFSDLGHRPQQTVYRWDKPDEQTPLQGFEQLTVWGNTYYVPRTRLWYTVDDTLTDSPAGMGILRHVVEHSRRLQLLHKWEGFAYEKDLRGIPVGRAPISKMLRDAGIDPKSPAAATFVATQTKFLTDFLQNHLKGNNNNQAMFFDSAHFATEDAAKTPSAVPQWALDILTGDSGPLAEINATIQRITWEIAALMNAEWLLVGRDSGAYQLHESKTAMYAQRVNGTLRDLGDTATADLARPLIAMNGLNPETATPALAAEPVSTEAIMNVTRALLEMAQAGSPLMPDDPAINQVRSRLYLEAQPKIAPNLALPQRPAVLPRESLGAEEGAPPPKYLTSAPDGKPAPAAPTPGGA
jgi:hypothetical protein